MKTLEVLERVLRGKRIKEDAKRHYNDALKSLSSCSEEWPSDAVVINEWISGLTRYADTTVRNWFNYVNSAGKYIKKNYKLDNPCEFAEKPKVEKKRRRYFTAEEIVRIIMACRFEQDKLLILTLIDSTCRIGELVGLESKNVGDGWIDVKGKTGERRYRCDSLICDKLRECGKDGQPIFKNRWGGAASESSLKHRVRRVVIEAGITGKKLGPHTIRHSGGSLVAQVTGSALIVKALLQHDKIDTSMEYIHDAEEVIQQRVSPLRLVGEKVFGDGASVYGGYSQLQITGGKDDIEVSVDGDSGVSEIVIDLISEQFRDIDDGVVVRSRLSDDDLRLIRRAFIGYVGSGVAGGDEVKCKELFKRMLRKK